MALRPPPRYLPQKRIKAGKEHTSTASAIPEQLLNQLTAYRFPAAPHGACARRSSSGGRDKPHPYPSMLSRLSQGRGSVEPFTPASMVRHKPPTAQTWGAVSFFTDR